MSCKNGYHPFRTRSPRPSRSHSVWPHRHGPLRPPRPRLKGVRGMESCRTLCGGRGSYRCGEVCRTHAMSVDVEVWPPNTTLISFQFTWIQAKPTILPYSIRYKTPIFKFLGFSKICFWTYK